MKELHVNAGRILRYTAHLSVLAYYLEETKKYWNSEDSYIKPYFKGQMTKAFNLVEKYKKVMPAVVRQSDVEKAYEELNYLIYKSDKEMPESEKKCSIDKDFINSYYGMKYVLESMELSQKEVDKIKQINVKVSEIKKILKPYIQMCEKEIIGVA